MRAKRQKKKLEREFGDRFRRTEFTTVKRLGCILYTSGEGHFADK